jgi:hypothetical protein
MADDSILFVLVGEVESWDPIARVLYVGRTRLDVAPGVAVDALIPKQPVTVTGHRGKHDVGSWVVTQIKAYRPGF